LRSAQLAIDGGAKVRTAPLPTNDNISGRVMGDDEIENLTNVIRSGHLFRYGGKYVVGFEEGFAKRYGAKHAVACTSGTAAIHIAIGAIQPNPGDEIITAPITDMGSIIGILFQNAIPVFADLDPETYTMTPESIEQRITDRTAAIIVVHLFGHPADMDPILKIAAKRNIPVIEDCAQAYLTEYHGKLAGTIGIMGCFSLQQSKHMTAGDGGIVITDDDDLAVGARLFADKGWPRGGEVRDYLFLGANYRMNELTGAVAYAQLGRVEGVVSRRRATAEKLTARLNTLDGVNPPVVRANCKHSFWQYPFTIDEQRLTCTPKEFAAAVGAEGIPCGHGYIGQPIYMTRMLHEQTAYGTSKCPWVCQFAGRKVEYQEQDCPNTVEILRRILLLYWNENFTDQDIQDMGDALEKVAAHYRKP
jgi:perosamine synthetase